jgi:hypothetical protein
VETATDSKTPWRNSFRSNEGEKAALVKIADELGRDPTWVSRAFMLLGIDKYLSDPLALGAVMRRRSKKIKKKTKTKKKAGRS